MSEFAYNNAKSSSTGCMPFKLNCNYYLQVFFEDDADPCFRSCSANELAKELKELIDICQQTLLHAQKLQKKANDKGVKLWHFTPGEKVWLNSKYIKTKQNQKLKAKFFNLFQVLHLVEK